MSILNRPRRSVLYMPGSNDRALNKGRSLPADGLILDLEDAVSPDQKIMSRQQVMDHLNQGGYGSREIHVRVNALNTSWGYDDILATCQSKADTVLIPKVESVQTVRDVNQILNAQGAPESLKIWCMIETPMGILNVKEIASGPRLGGLVMGTSDLAKDLHCQHTPMRLPMITSLEMSVLAARAYGLSILDGVYLDLQNDQGFKESCQQGAEMGFDGKTLIHPKTVDVTNDIFSPSQQEVDFSRKIIQAHGQAQKSGQGVVVVDGKLIENLHVENAHRVVSLWDQIQKTSV